MWGTAYLKQIAMHKQGILFAIGLLAMSIASYGQDAKGIMEKTYSKCQSIQSGSYYMTKHMKYMSTNDTSKSSFDCAFEKLKDDTLYSCAFHYKAFLESEYTGDVLYTGSDFLTTNNKDSTATIMSTALWAKEIQAYRHNYTFYTPFTTKDSSPLPHDSDFVDGRYTFKFIGEEYLNDSPCYHVQVNEIPENDTESSIKTLQIEFHYWIIKSDFVPIQFSTAYDVVMNNDTMHQYEKDVFNRCEINDLKDKSILTLNSIPPCYRIKDFIPYKGPSLLPNDTLAPNWELPSLTGEQINLTDLSGQLVLIDFFYKSCYPCMQALPTLQALNERYEGKGLRVVGIDPYDKREDGITTFLSKRGVTYMVLLGGKEVSKDYRVSAYPTMYLIDKTGKIILSQVGYGKGTEGMLEEIIKKNL